MNGDPYLILVLGAVLASVAMFVLWLLQLRLKDASSVDVAWAFGVGALAVLYSVWGDGYGPRRLLAGALGATWAFRLGFYLLRDRVLKAQEEDGRYRMLRAQWGERAQVNFFMFYQVQALFVMAFALPFFVVSMNAHPALTGWDVLGVAVWVVAIGGEWTADRQLSGFRQNPENRGKVCRIGLWRYSRHPNYFFEWLHWWAYVPMGLFAPYGWMTILGPAFMLYLLFFMTGIPYTEKRALESRGEAYRRYQRETSVFVPWFSREVKHEGGH
ncbi:MAG: DUF1295 domain-containing protein [bacterium]|nr:DUF1295 domain-containing protein [bacterium]